jgi:hypothetical protein
VLAGLRILRSIWHADHAPVVAVRFEQLENWRGREGGAVDVRRGSDIFVMI